MSTLSRYQVLVSSAQMPVTCWGRYSRVAVVEVDPEILAAEGLEKPRMISNRARGVVRIVRTWERCHVGTTKRSAVQRALTAARDLITDLENGVR